MEGRNVMPPSPVHSFSLARQDIFYCCSFHKRFMKSFNKAGRSLIFKGVIHAISHFLKALGILGLLFSACAKQFFK